MPEGLPKAALLLLAPSITLISAWAWALTSAWIDSLVADRKIADQKRKAEKIYKNLAADPTTDPKMLESARQVRDAIWLLEIEKQKRRAEAIVI